MRPVQAEEGRGSDSQPATRRVESTRLGVIEVPDAQVLHFPRGLIGFERVRSFVLFEHQPGSAFGWLQSTDAPELSFLVVDPTRLVTDYPVRRLREALEWVELPDDEPILALAICCVPPAPSTPNVNLLAPLGIGARARRGAQVVLHDCDLDLRAPLALAR